MAVNGLAFGPDTGRRVVEGEPQIRFRHLLRNPVHRHIFTPQPPAPALDAPGNLDIPDAREVAQFLFMDQCGHRIIRAGREILQAIPQYRQRPTPADVYR